MNNDEIVEVHKLYSKFPPSRSTLIKYSQYFYPIIFVLLFLNGLLFFLTSSEYVSGIIWIFVTSLFFIILNWANYLSKLIEKKVGKNQISTWLLKDTIGHLGVAGTCILFVLVAISSKTNQILSIVLWPIFIFPIQIVIGRYKDDFRKLQKTLVFLYLFSVPFLFLADLISIGAIYTENFSLAYSGTLPPSSEILTTLKFSVFASLWFGLFIIDSYFRIFRSSLHKTRDAAVRSVIREVTNLPNGEPIKTNKSFFQEIVNKIHWLHRDQIVSIVYLERGGRTLDKGTIYYSPHENIFLKVIAAAGITQEIISKIGPWSATMGITGEMVRNQNLSYILENNVTKLENYYQPTEWPIKTKSELVIPIEAGGILYGMLDIQSKNSHDFSLDDIDALTAIVKPISAKIQERDIRELYLSDRELWKELSSQYDLNQVVNCFGNYIQKYAMVDIGFFYLLATGTGYPDLKPSAFGGFNDSDSFINGLPSNIINKLVSGNEEIYKSDIRNDPDLVVKNPGIKTFVERESVFSMCFLPISLGRRRLGCLFLFYRSYESFGPMRRLTITVLTQTLTHHIGRMRYEDPLYRKIFQPRFRLHHILNRSGLSKDKLSSDFDELSQSAPELTKKIESLKYRILQGYKEAYFEGAVTDIDFSKEQLATQLQSFAGSMQLEHNFEKPKLRIRPYIDSLIEDEMPEMKLIIMYLATEGTFNAIKHSHANKICIRIKRTSESIICSIKNDNNTGKKIYRTKFESSKYGILFMLEQLKEGVFADHKWIIDNRNRTIELVVTFPALPI